MKKSHAIKLAKSLISKGSIFSDENQNEWLTDGNTWVWMNQNSDWKDWDLDDKDVNETSVLVPDESGGQTMLVCRYSKNQDCNNPVELSDLEIFESANNVFQIRKA